MGDSNIKCNIRNEESNVCYKMLCIDNSFLTVAIKNLQVIFLLIPMKTLGTIKYYIITLRIYPGKYHSHHFLWPNNFLIIGKFKS